MGGMSGWLAAYCAEGAEFDVCERLSAVGVVAFCPYQTVTLRHKSSNRRGQHVKREKNIPIFEPYVFAQTDDHSELKRIRGVLTVVKVAGQPILISDKVIDGLKAQLGCDQDGKVLDDHWFKGKVGDSVELRGGSALKGLIGKISDISQIDVSEQITVSVEFMGKQAFRVPIADVLLRS